MEERVVALLHDQDWDWLTARLLRYAKRKVTALTWSTGSGVDAMLPQGHGIEDLVEEAILCVYSGRRTWDPDRHPDLFKFLCGTVDSLVSHLVASLEHRRRAPVCLEDAPEPADSEDPILDVDAQRCEEECLDRALAAVADDPDLTCMFELVFDGEVKAARIAEILGVPVEVVYRRKEKLKRRLSKAGFGLQEGRR